MAKVTEKFGSNNLVPIIVALIAALGGYFANHSANKDKLSELEKKVEKMATIEYVDSKIKVVQDEMKLYADLQKSINDITLRKMAESTVDDTARKQFEYQRYSNYITYKKNDIKKTAKK